jgi:uncharacterized protein
MNQPGDRELRSILSRARSIAVVGLSSKSHRPSYEVASYLQRKGYRIVPVNPNEEEVLEEKAYPSVSAVPHEIDVVDVFRRPEHTLEVARQAVQAGTSVLWLQLGIVNEEARRIAEDAGLQVVMDMCMMTTHARLMAEPRGAKGA